MTWQDRNRGNIVLTSPNGTEFEAFWTGDPRSFSKKLGIFSYPKIIGDVVQDLGSSSVKYPLTISFNGGDHDLDADLFFETCKEKGLWTIQHPIKGNLLLQLVDVSEAVQPVENSNTSVFGLSFMEPISDEIVASVPELGSIVDQQNTALNDRSFGQFIDKVRFGRAAGKAAIALATNIVANASELALAPLFSISAELNSNFNAIKSGIAETLTADIFNPGVLAGQLQNLIQLPFLSTDEIQPRLDAYNNLALSLFSLGTDLPTDDGINTLTVKDLALTTIIGSLAQISVTGLLQTRSQVVETIEFIQNLFSNITDNLDEGQTQYCENPIDSQYFSQSETFNDAFLIITQASEYLLKRSLDLSFEKTIILKEPRTPIEITITEYGDLGENESNYDLFLSSNKLKGNDILILQAGTAVVVYV